MELMKREGLLAGTLCGFATSEYHINILLGTDCAM